MERKYTPGPWKATSAMEVYMGKKILCRVNAANRKVAGMGDDIAMAKANARLIAASPDLLEALLDVLPELESIGPLDKFEKARAAIHKAIST